MNRVYGQIDIRQSAERKSAAPLVDSRPFLATVIHVYSDRNTCDLEVPSKEPMDDVPVVGISGQVGDEVYGTLDLPEIDDVVVVRQVRGQEYPVIIGSIISYLTDEFSTKQTAVKSSSKVHTLKLIEKDKEKFYRKIFKSGTTMEVQDDGTLIIETPSGYYIMIDEANSKIVMEANSNTFSMESGKVVINGNLEVLQ